MISDFLLPSSPTDFGDAVDRSIARSSRAWFGARLPCWRDDDVRISVSSRPVERSSVVGRVGDDGVDTRVDLLDELDAGRCVVDVRVGECLSDNRARVVDGEMKLHPTLSASMAVFGSSPLPLADDRQAGAVDDEIDRAAARVTMESDVQRTGATRKRRVIRRGEIEIHEAENRSKEAFGLTQRKVENEAQSQRGFDGKVGVLRLGSASSFGLRRPCRDCIA